MPSRAFFINPNPSSDFMHFLKSISVLVSVSDHQHISLFYPITFQFFR